MRNENKTEETQWKRGMENSRQGSKICQCSLIHSFIFFFSMGLAVENLLVEWPSAQSLLCHLSYIHAFDFIV